MKMKAEIGVIVHRPRSPKRASSQQELGRGWGRVSLTADRRNQMDLGPVASRAGRESIPTVSVPSLWYFIQAEAQATVPGSSHSQHGALSARRMQDLNVLHTLRF